METTRYYLDNKGKTELDQESFYLPNWFNTKANLLSTFFHLIEKPIIDTKLQSIKIVIDLNG